MLKKTLNYLSQKQEETIDLYIEEHLNLLCLSPITQIPHRVVIWTPASSEHDELEWGSCF